MTAREDGPDTVRRRASEIEDAIAAGQMGAAQVFTQMRQLIATPGAGAAWQGELRGLLRESLEYIPRPTGSSVERFPRLVDIRERIERALQHCPVCSFTMSGIGHCVNCELDSAGNAQGEGSIYEAFKSWPADIRAKLSLHDLRRMDGWAPKTKFDAWCIDHSAGRPILMYRGCSVIEAEDARYVLGLIAKDSAPQPAADAGAIGDGAVASQPRVVDVYKDENGFVETTFGAKEAADAGDGAVDASELMPCPCCKDARVHVYFDEIRDVAYAKCMDQFPKGAACGRTVTVSISVSHNTPEKAKAEAARRWNEQAITSRPAAAAQVPDADAVLTEYCRICIDEHHEDAPREYRVEAMRRALATAAPAAPKGGVS